MIEEKVVAKLIFARKRKHTPGLKAPFLQSLLRAKPEGLAYLEAK
jgi:hypothetical protein